MDRESEYKMFHIIRLVVLIFVIFICYVLYKSFTMKRIISKLISMVLIIFVSMFILFLPIENVFIRFGEPSESFKYTHPLDNIVDVLEYKNNAAILYSKDNSFHYAFIKKDANGWLISNPNVNFGPPVISVKNKHYVDYENVQDNIYFIYISTFVHYNQYPMVFDSKNTEYSTLSSKEIKDMRRGMFYSFVEVDNDFYLVVDNEKVVLR